MRAGTLTKHGTVMRQTSEPDAFGQEQADWTVLATFRCSLKPIGGSERSNASGEHAIATHRVRLRYDRGLADFCPSDRLTINGADYNILLVINVGERNREFEVLCEKSSRV